MPDSPSIGPRESPFSPIPEILDDLRDGKMIILVDDEDRENEGDLVCAAETVTPEGEAESENSGPAKLKTNEPPSPSNAVTIK